MRLAASISLGLTGLVMGAIAPRVATAAEVSFGGEATADLRIFADRPTGGRDGRRIEPSLVLNPGIEIESADGRHQFTLAPFARIDAIDDKRTHADVREAYWRYVANDWELLVGINRVFWGVTESRHLVNVINQIDQLEDVDEEEFLGQPMVAAKLYRDWGELSVYLLPGFRTRDFADEGGHFAAPLPVAEDAAQFGRGAGKDDVGAAVRYANTFGAVDLGISYFHGTGREPELRPDASGGHLVPLYSQINQVGLDLQLTKDAWLWKFEGLVREGQGRTFAALVGGFEYTFFQSFGTPADISLLAEYLWDGRDLIEAPVTYFQNDLFLGLRAGLNDTWNSSLLAGAVIDLEDGTVALRIEAERRLSNNWSLALDVQLFANVARGNPLNTFRKDSFLNVGLHYFF